MIVPHVLETIAARHSTKRDARAEAREALRAGPWVWPPEGSELWDVAAKLAGCPQPPAVRLGELLVVSTNPTRAAVWALRSGAGTPAGAVELAEDARFSWRTAAQALPRSVPVLASSTRELGTQMPVGVFAGMCLAPCVMELKDHALVGPSFGLAFVLSMASRLLGQPVPENVTASAEVDGLGGLRPVGEIHRKIHALAACRNRPTTLLVAHGQAGLPPESALHPNLAVKVVRSATEAISFVFPDAARQFVERAGTDASSRRIFARNMLGLVLEGRSAVLEWAAVHEAARLAEERWHPLECDVAQSLKLARAVALRHDGHGDAPPLPTAEWLGQVPLSRRVELVAQFLQQCHDTGTPPFEEVEALARPHLAVAGEEAYEPHLKVRGAWGRLIAVRGDLSGGLACQEAAADGFARRFTMSEVSFPLSAWYRLAGTLPDVEAFERAEVFRADADGRGGLAEPGWAYVELARARAGVLLGHGDRGAWIRTLESLALAPPDPQRAAMLRTDIPAHVALSAARWLIRFREDEGASAPGAEAEVAKAASEPTDGLTAALSASGRLNALLVRLDRAVRSEDASKAADAVKELQALRPALMAHLLGWAPAEPLARAGHVALHLPY